jgi:hypothetical protein
MPSASDTPALLRLTDPTNAADTAVKIDTRLSGLEGRAARAVTEYSRDVRIPSQSSTDLGVICQFG